MNTNRPVPTLHVLILSALLVGCEALQGPPVHNPAVLAIVAGNSQAAPPEAQLPEPIIVRVTTSNGDPVEGQPVLFEMVSGGGSVSPASMRTNASGVAQTLWTLGPAAGGQQAVRALSRAITTGNPLPPVTFIATVRVPPPASIAKVRGDAQTTTAGGLLPDTLVVRVLDARGQPVRGAEARWAVTLGGGTVLPPISLTDVNGLAKATWTLGTREAEQRVSAMVSGLDSVVFSATVAAPTTALGTLTKMFDGQSGTVGQTLGDSIALHVTFADGRPANGVPVTWTVSSRLGSMSPRVSLTNSLGIARSAWVLGTTAGQQTVTATVVGAAPLTFSAQGLAADPASLTRHGGEGQIGVPESVLADPLAVQLRDQYGNVVAGRTVSWATTGGGGALNPSASVTDAAGIATTRWRLGSSLGAQSASASFGELQVTFAATSTRPVVASVTKSGDSQVGRVDQILSDSVTVYARLADGRPAAGVAVTWTAASGGGRIVSPAVVTTNIEGIARAAWRLGTLVGSNTATATAGGLVTTFSATARADTAVTLQLQSGSSQTSVLGQALSNPLVVRVADKHGNGVSGRNVRWAVTAGGGSITTTSSSGANGDAVATWVLGTVAGAHAATATVSGLSHDSTVTFTANASIPSTATITKNFDLQSGQVGQTLPNPITVTVRLEDQRPVVGATVTWSATSGSGTVGSGGSTTVTTTTNSAGVASVPWTLGPAAGTHSVRAVVVGLTEVTFSATATTP